MPEKKFSLEDILEEYPADRKQSELKEPEEIQKVIESAVSDAEQAEIIPTKVSSSGKKVEFDPTLRNRNPANEVKPSDIRKVTVREVNSIHDAMASYGRTRRRNINYDVPIEQDDSEPKIRRMADSTRAREIAEQKKKKKKRISFTYKKETPIGEYVKEPEKSVFHKEKGNSEENKSEQKRKEENSPQKIKQGEPAFRFSEKSNPSKNIAKLRKVIEMRTMILAITSLLSLAISLIRQFNADFTTITSDPYTYLSAQLLLGVLSVLSSLSVIAKGMRSIVKFRPDTDSMTTLTVLSCIITIIPEFFGIDLLKENITQVYMPVGITALLINSIGKQLILKRASRNNHFILKCPEKYGLAFVENEERSERLTLGAVTDLPILSAMRKTENLTDFLKYSYSHDIADSYCIKAVPACMISALIPAIVFTFLRNGTLFSAEGTAFGFSVYNMFICAGACIGLPLTANLPLDIISQKLLRNRGAILGYKSVDELYDVNSVLVSADMLFPEGTVSAASVKIFSKTRTNEALLEAASLAFHANSIMIQLFDDVVKNNYGILYPVENFSVEENMGYCGWIRNKRILFGNRDLMTSHSIEGLPSKSKESEYAESGQEILYLSVSGNISAMFAVEVRSDKKVKKWAKRLCRNKVSLIVKSTDPCITVKKISRLMDVPVDMIKVIPKRLHSDFDAETSSVENLSSSMVCTGRFTSLAQLLTGCKIVYSSAVRGLILNTVFMLFGIIFCLLLMITKAYETDYIYASAFAMAEYNIICTAITYLTVTAKKL